MSNQPSASETIVVLITASGEEEAGRMANILVEEKLAACCNIVPVIRSIYRWEGKICDDTEALIIVKSKKSLFPSIEKRVRELHSYQVPEIIAFPLSDGSASYLDWLHQQLI